METKTPRFLKPATREEAGRRPNEITSLIQGDTCLETELEQNRGKNNANEKALMTECRFER